MFGPSGYVEDATEAYALLTQLKQNGRVDRATRLLVAIPTPYDILNFAIDQHHFTALAPVYEQYLLSEVRKIAQVIPAGELAFQWDAAHEFEYLATSSLAFNAMSREEMVDMSVRLERARRRAPSSAITAAMEISTSSISSSRPTRRTWST